MTLQAVGDRKIAYDNGHSGESCQGGHCARDSARQLPASSGSFGRPRQAAARRHQCAYLSDLGLKVLFRIRIQYHRMDGFPAGLLFVC